MMMKDLVRLFHENIRPIDIVGRISSNRIGVILIERNKRQSKYLGTKVQEAVIALLAEQVSVPPEVVIGVAENPIDGASAEELISHSIQELSP